MFLFLDVSTKQGLNLLARSHASLKEFILKSRGKTETEKRSGTFKCCSCILLASTSSPVLVLKFKAQCIFYGGCLKFLGFSFGKNVFKISI